MSVLCKKNGILEPERGSPFHSKVMDAFNSKAPCAGAAIIDAGTWQAGSMINGEFASFEPRAAAEVKSICTLSWEGCAFKRTGRNWRDALQGVWWRAGFSASFNNSLISFKACHIFRLLQAQGGLSDKWLWWISCMLNTLLQEVSKTWLISFYPCAVGSSVAIPCTLSELKQKSRQAVPSRMECRQCTSFLLVGNKGWYDSHLLKDLHPQVEHPSAWMVIYYFQPCFPNKRETVGSEARISPVMLLIPGIN